MVRVPRAARRSNSAHVPEHEWRQVQKYIERLYLDEDKGAKHITQALRQEHRLQVTERQLKTRLRIWGYDNKKIPGLLYRAMGYVMEQLGHEVTFKAILLNDRKTRILPAAEVRKEVRRQKREYQPEWHNLQTALDRLQRHKITVVNQRAPPTTTVIANQQPTSDNLHRDLPDETDSDDSNSTMSWDSLPEEGSGHEIHALEDNSYQLPRPQFNLTDSNLDTSLRPRMWHQVPNLGAFAINLHQSVLPQTAANQIVTGFGSSQLAAEPRIVPVSETLEDLTSELAHMTLTLHQNDPRRAPWEKFLGVSFEQYYRPAAREGSRLIIEFVAYYIQQSLAGFDTLDDYNHADRKEARAKFTSMLNAENEQILTAINWISAVIGANDKQAQLSAFYEDCWACIEHNNSLAAQILRPSICFALLMHGDDQRTPKDLQASPDTRRSRREKLAATFDGDKEFQDSISLVVRHGQQDSPTHLILRYHCAWFLLHKQRASAALDILLPCRHMAERLMGCNHLVTVNCYTMVARAREMEGEFQLAISDLKIALVRLNSCPNPLQAYLHRLVDRLACLLLRIGEKETALCNFERVLAFKLRTLGACPGSTWATAKNLFATLGELGRHEEARVRGEELRALHDAEWYKMRAAMV